MILKLQRTISVLFFTIVLAISFSAPSYAAKIPQIEWTLTSLNNHPPVENTKTTIQFSFDDANTGKINGSGGCNRYFAQFTLPEDTSSQIQISQLGSTRAFCGNSSEQEAEFFSALSSVETYELINATLLLTNSETTRLEFSVPD